MSKAHAECLYPFRPDVDARERPPGKEARHGSATHKLMEQHEAKKRGLEISLDGIDPSDLAAGKVLFEGPFRGWLDRHTWDACELGLRYDAENDTATIGPRRGEPGYEAIGPMVLAGTLDLVRIADGALWIPDLKTGKKDNAHPEQLYAQAVAASRLYGITTAYVGFVFARKTKCDEPAWEALDADRLDAEAGKIRRKLRMIPDAEPVINPGCVYCNARHVCPAQAAPPLGVGDLDAMSAF